MRVQSLAARKPPIHPRRGRRPAHPAQLEEGCVRLVPRQSVPARRSAPQRVRDACLVHEAAQSPLVTPTWKHPGRATVHDRADAALAIEHRRAGVAACDGQWPSQPTLAASSPSASTAGRESSARHRRVARWCGVPKIGCGVTDTTSTMLSGSTGRGSTSSGLRSSARASIYGKGQAQSAASTNRDVLAGARASRLKWQLEDAKRGPVAEV